MPRKTLSGFLVVIEGIDGAGKTTQARLLAEQLQEMSFSVVSSREPTNGKWGKLLKESAKTGRLSPEEELNAFIEDRKEHVEGLIRPQLENGRVVILDRYYFSTVAYQGARGLNVQELMQRNEEFAPEPDLLVLLDVEPEIGLRRIHERGDEVNQFEREAALAKAREIFNQIEKPYLLRLDAGQEPETIRDSIIEKFKQIA